MVSAAELEKMQARQQYRNLWHVDLINSIGADTPYCCFALCCSPCASYLLRKRALYNNMSRYTCCAGYLPCSGHCGESSCPEFCLCTEVFCCFANSVASTRFLLQDEFNIQTTKCDNCIIGFMLCLQQLACIFSCIACLLGSEELTEAAQCLRCLSDSTYYMVCACMQTQHKIEMDKRDGKFFPQPVLSVPPAQQMSRDQRLPPPVQYPPEPALGYFPPPGPPLMAPGYPSLPHQAPFYPSPPQVPGYQPTQQVPGCSPPPPQVPSHSPPHQVPAGYSPPHQVPAGYSPPHLVPEYPSPQQASAYTPPSQQAPGYPPPEKTPGYPPHQQAPGYPPPEQTHGYSPPHQAPCYPPPEQAPGYPPHQQAPGYSPPQQAHGYPSAVYPPSGYPAPGYPHSDYPYQPQPQPP